MRVENTAAGHCGNGIRQHVQNVSQELLVVARQLNLENFEGATRHKVCDLTIHPKYNGTNPYKLWFGNMDYDFAILTLCEPLMFDKGKFLSLSFPSLSQTT